MNTTMKKFAAVAVVALSGAAISGDAMAGSDTGNASATIATPISVSETTALAFGTILAGASSSTIVIDNAGARTVGSGDTLSSGGNTMAIGSFTNNSGGSLSGGTDSFNVGATLTVGASQAAGSYSGTYTVTVNYQ